MRIVSLLPAATEIVHALGLADELVGIDAACDRASETGGPAVVSDGSGLLDDALQSVRPDLVLVGGDDPDAPDAAAEERLRLLVPDATVMRLAPMSIEGVFHAVTSVGAMAEAEDEAVGLVELLRERLLAVEERVQARRVAGRQPRRVVLLDGLAPPRVAGRWVPEQIRRAGGWDVLGREGQPSDYVAWEAVADVDPEVIVVAPAGTRLGGAGRELGPAPARRAMTGGPAATFDCLWCGRSWRPRSPEDLEGWARLCPDCLGKAGDNPFLRLRLREALAARAAAGSAAGPASAAAPTPATLVPPAPLARPRGPAAVPPATLDDWYLRRGGFAKGPLHDVAWQADLDAAGRWLDGLSLGHVIVELSDGTGWWAPLLAAMGELWCFDSDPAALERTRERLLAHGLRAHLHLRDAWPEPELQADAMFAAFRLGRLPAADRPAFLELARRWLRPGGTLAVVELAVEAGRGLRTSKVGGSDVGASDLAGSDVGASDLAGSDVAGSDLRHATPEVDASSSPAVAGLPVALAASDLRAALRQTGFGAVEVARPGRWLLLGRATA